MLARVPGLRITEDGVITLDSRRGTAFGVGVDQDWHEILIDPATGALLGTRQLVAVQDGPLVAGSWRSTSSTTVESVTPNEAPLIEVP